LGFIIIKAREYEAEVEPVDEDSGSNPTDDGSRDILEATADNPTRRELKAAVNSLNEDQRIELLALTWLGRGDYLPGDWDEAMEEAARRHDRREAEYLASTPLLSDYLEEGLELLGYSPEDTDDPDRPLS
jgi:hypothetical protein